MVWAAGNDSRNLTLNDRDADDIIVAGATDSGDSLSSFSAYGQFVDVVAPGSAVYTTDTANNSDYSAVSGTSFSTPLTAGLIALIWSADPLLTPDEVETLLKQGCDDLGSPGVDNTYAYGRINVLNSLPTARAITFDLPNGTPAIVDPAGATTIRVDVLADDSNPVSGTGRVHYFDGAVWQSSPMTEVNPNSYDAVVRAVAGSDCGDMVQYYFSAEATDGNTYTNPSNAPASSYTSQAYSALTTMVDLDFESSSGWTVQNVNVADGAWDRGIPVGGGDRGDPAADHDGSGQCWLTDNADGNSDVDGGPTRLLSPIYDLTGMAGVRVSYARWFTNDDGDGDRLDVEVSSNGGSSWVLVESVSSSGTWTVQEFVVEDFVPLTSQFQVRFSATDNPNDSVTEAGIDRFRILTYDCPLLLDVTPTHVDLGDSLAYTTFKGQPGTLGILFLTGINGNPWFQQMAKGFFNASGDWVLNANVPNNGALSGVVLDMSGLGTNLNGQFQVTAQARLTIQ